MVSFEIYHDESLSPHEASYLPESVLCTPSYTDHLPDSSITPPLRLTSRGTPLTPTGSPDSSISSLFGSPCFITSPGETSGDYIFLSPSPRISTPDSIPLPMQTSTPNDVTSSQRTEQHHQTRLDECHSFSPPKIFFPPEFLLPSSIDMTTEDQIRVSQAFCETSPHPSYTNSSSPITTSSATSSTTPSSFGKTRRGRPSALSYSQSSALLEEFERSPYISTERRRRLSAELGVTSVDIRVWFLNQRRQVVSTMRCGSVNNEKQYDSVSDDFNVIDL